MQDLEGVIDNNERPTFMPEVGASNYIVCAVQLAKNPVKLTVCKTLEQMQNQFAWAVSYVKQNGGVGGIAWLYADREQCDTAHEKLVAASA